MVQASYRIEIERPTDDEITTRDRASRVASVIFFSTLIIAIPTLIFGSWGNSMNFPTVGTLFGFLAGSIALAAIAPARMFVYNPEWCGYVTQDVSAGTMVPYGPGLHASHLWEQRNARGNYSLAVQRQSFNAGVSTGSGKVNFEGEYEFAIDLALIERAIGVSQAVVEKGITSFIENLLTARYADMDVKNVRAKEEIEKLGRDLSNELMNAGGTLGAIHKKYGYKTVSIVIDKISLPGDVQKTRNALDEAGVLFEIVAKLYGMTKEELSKQIQNGAITPTAYQKMLTRAMAVSDNKTGIDVKVIEGLEGSSNPAAQAATLFGALSKKGGGKKKGDEQQ